MTKPATSSAKPLTPKQRRFVEEYLVDRNGTQAAIRAGYSEKTARKIASENVTKPDIRAAIRAAEADLSKRTEITQTWVLERLAQNAERAAQAEPVLDSNGAPTGDYTYNGSVVNRALELLGKHVGLFKDEEKKGADERVRVDINISDGIGADTAATLYREAAKTTQKLH